MKLVKLKTINIKSHPVLNEKWLQDAIADDPGILGLGEIEYREREVNVGSGRLDLLFQDVDGDHRYVVEVQLGASDPSHIIRTIEYWDIRRKRYPHYEHTAVLIAEDITSRFLNVISLFNGFIPLIAIQFSAVELPDGNVGLHFVKVLDAVNLGLDDEVADPTDRDYWKAKANMELFDDVHQIVKDIEASAVPNYTKYYIGFSIDGAVKNFVTCRPKKAFLWLETKHKPVEKIQQQLEELGFIIKLRGDSYLVQITGGDTADEAKKAVLIELLRATYNASMGARA